MHRRFSTFPKELHGYDVEESLKNAINMYFRLLWQRGCASLIDVEKVELMVMDVHHIDETLICILRVSFKDGRFFYDQCNVYQGELDETTHQALVAEEYPLHMYECSEVVHVLDHLEDIYPDPTAYLYDPSVDDTFLISGKDIMMDLVDHCEP